MKKLGILTAVTAAVALSSGVALAKHENIKCHVVKDGKSIIKESASDCKTAAHACAGKNKAGEADAFILVPKGVCKKLNAGDFKHVSKEIRAKIEGAE